MTVDFRASIATTLGRCISGDVGNTHVGDGTGLIKTRGRLLMDGTMSPARGTAVGMLIVRQQLGIITRFPKPLFVLRAVPNIIDRTTEVEIGCWLTLMEDLKRKEVYDTRIHTPFDWVEEIQQLPPTSTPNQIVQFYNNFYYRAPWPIEAQKLMEFCLDKIGLELSSSSVPLQFRFLQSRIGLENGYVQMIGDLIRSESKFGRILPDGKLQVQDLNFNSGQMGPVLTTDNLYSIEAIDGAAEPPTEYTVQFNGVEVGATTPASWGIGGVTFPPVRIPSVVNSAP
jgi:hypothetical protein